MRPEVLTILAVLMYGSQNVLLERHLGNGANVATFQMWFNGALFLFATLMAIPTKGVAMLPAAQLGSIALLAAIFFLADLCVFLAYAGKGDAFMVGTILCAMPIVIGIVKFGVDRKLPTTYEIIGMGLVVVGVILFLKK